MIRNPQAQASWDGTFFRLYLPGPVLNANDRLNRFRKAEWVEVHRTEARLVTHAHMAKEGTPPFSEPVVIFHQRWTPNHPARIDGSNIQPGTKAIVDGIVDAGLLPGDSGQHLPAETFLSPRINAKRHAVLVTITTLAHYLANPAEAFKVAGLDLGQVITWPLSTAS
jgi:hypothetical protein